MCFKVTSFWLERGTQIGNYRVIRQLGRGFEGEVYLAVEIPTGARRALKLYPEGGVLTVGDLVLRARLLDRLSQTGATVRYFHMGRALLGRGVPVLYHVLEYVDGEQLQTYVRKIRGPERQRTAHALRLVLAIASNLARVHRLGMAVGDIDSPVNILVRKNDGQPVICDGLFAEGGQVNRDYRNDLRELREICLLITAGARAPQLERLLLQVLNRYLRQKTGRNSLRNLVSELKRL